MCDIRRPIAADIATYVENTADWSRVRTSIIHHKGHFGSLPACAAPGTRVHFSDPPTVSRRVALTASSFRVCASARSRRRSSASLSWAWRPAFRPWCTRCQAVAAALLPFSTSEPQRRQSSIAPPPTCVTISSPPQLAQDRVVGPATSNTGVPYRAQAHRIACSNSFKATTARPARACRENPVHSPPKIVARLAALRFSGSNATALWRLASSSATRR